MRDPEVYPYSPSTLPYCHEDKIQTSTSRDQAGSRSPAGTSYRLWFSFFTACQGISKPFISEVCNWADARLLTLRTSFQFPGSTQGSMAKPNMFTGCSFRQNKLSMGIPLSDGLFVFNLTCIQGLKKWSAFPTNPHKRSCEMLRMLDMDVERAARLKFAWHVPKYTYLPLPNWSISKPQRYFTVSSPNCLV